MPAPTAPRIPASSPATSAKERRAAPRFALGQPAKISIQGQPRFQSAQVLNLSTSGALLSMHPQTDLRPGDWIQLGLPGSPAPVIRKSAMPPCQIVRSQTQNDAATLAVRFAEPQATLVAFQTAQPKPNKPPAAS